MRSLERHASAGMMVGNVENACHISRGYDRAVSQCRDSVYLFSAQRLDDRRRFGLRRFKMRRNGVVAPRVLQLVAAIRNVNNLHAVFLSDFLKAARLVAQLIGE